MTLTLRNENNSRPRFEFYPVNSSVLRTVVVKDYPFVIGRGDHTQLKINSTSVSREHARLTRTAEGFRLEDMKSTNGTQVNGEAKGDVILEDGDTIRIAELELTFRCAAARPSSLERMVTQPLVGKKRPDHKADTLDLLSTQRALSEVLLWQTIPLCRTRIVDCKTKSLQATFVSVDEPIASQLRACACGDPYSTASRTQQLAWMLAAQYADDIAEEGTLFLRFDLHAGLDHRLCQTLELARESFSGNRPLGVLVPWNWAVQSQETGKLCADLKASGAELAFDAFSGGATCIDSMGNASPDLLVLAPVVVRNISSNPRSKNHLDRIVSHCRKSGIRVILPAHLGDEDYQEVCELGVDLVVSQDDKREVSQSNSPVALTV